MDLGVYCLHFASMVFGNDVKDIASICTYNNLGMDMQDSITDINGKLTAHIAADDERNAVQCRTRILRFADELINEPKHLHTQGNFEQCLQDITVYDQYCADHPKFKNELTLRSAEIIRKVYDECAREHKFL